MLERVRRALLRSAKRNHRKGGTMGESHSRLAAQVGGFERWVLCAAVSLAMFFSAADGHASQSPSPLIDEAEHQLTMSEITALHWGANQHPYATLGLIYILRDTSVVQDGTLYLESVPKATLTSLLLASADDNAIWSLLGVLQWSPYSVSEFFVQVSWSVQPLTSGTKVITFHTRLLIEGA